MTAMMMMMIIIIICCFVTHGWFFLCFSSCFFSYCCCCVFVFSFEFVCVGRHRRRWVDSVFGCFVLFFFYFFEFFILNFFRVLSLSLRNLRELCATFVKIDFCQQRKWVKVLHLLLLLLFIWRSADYIARGNVFFCFLLSIRLFVQRRRKEQSVSFSLSLN